MEKQKWLVFPRKTPSFGRVVEADTAFNAKKALEPLFGLACQDLKAIPGTSFEVDCRIACYSVEPAEIGPLSISETFGEKK